MITDDLSRYQAMVRQWLQKQTNLEVGEGGAICEG
jgi:hypothetical protein